MSFIMVKSNGCHATAKSSPIGVRGFVKVLFAWDDENIAHIAKHGHTVAEVERAVQDDRNQFITSRSSGRTGKIVRTRPHVRFALFWDEVVEKPLTVRVTTMYRV